MLSLYYFCLSHPPTYLCCRSNKSACSSCVTEFLGTQHQFTWDHTLGWQTRHADLKVTAARIIRSSQTGTSMAHVQWHFWKWAREWHVKAAAKNTMTHNVMNIWTRGLSLSWLLESGGNHKNDTHLDDCTKMGIVHNTNIWQHRQHKKKARVRVKWLQNKTTGSEWFWFLSLTSRRLALISGWQLGIYQYK